MAEAIEFPTAAVRETGQSVGAQIAQAARPGPVPVAGAGSVVDGAAATVAGAVIKNVAASSAELAPRSAEIVAKADTAVAEFQATDAENASRIKAVSEGMQERPPAAGNGAVQPASFGSGGAPLSPAPPSPSPTPKFPLDARDVIHLPPGELGPYGSMQLSPGSETEPSTWVPDPSVNEINPGLVTGEAKYPLDLADAVQLEPGAMSPPDHMQLTPGLWFPDPNSPTYVPHEPEFPIDLGQIAQLDPGAPGPPGYMQIGPGSWHPEPGAFGPR